MIVPNTIYKTSISPRFFLHFQEKRHIFTRSEKIWALSAKHSDAESVEDDGLGTPLWYVGLAADITHTNQSRIANLIDQISQTVKKCAPIPLAWFHISILGQSSVFIQILDINADWLNVCYAGWCPALTVQAFKEAGSYQFWHIAGK